MIKFTKIGTFQECMTIVKRSRMKNIKPNKRLFDRYDIEQLDSKTEVIDNRLRIAEYKTTEQYKITLYKD